MADLSSLSREQLIERRDLLIRRKELQSQLSAGTSQQAPTIIDALSITSEDLGIETGRLTPGERFKGGFRSPEDLGQRRAVQTQALGLPAGTPLEPTGFNLENLADFPNDVLDAVGPLIPALFETVAGVAGLFTGGPLLAAAAGAASAGVGEIVRQETGRLGFGFEQGTFGQRAGQVGLEAAFGLVGGATASVLSKSTRALASTSGVASLKTWTVTAGLSFYVSINVWVMLSQRKQPSLVLTWIFWPVPNLPRRAQSMIGQS